MPLEVTGWGRLYPTVLQVPAATKSKISFAVTYSALAAAALPLLPMLYLFQTHPGLDISTTHTNLLILLIRTGAGGASGVRPLAASAGSGLFAFFPH